MLTQEHPPIAPTPRPLFVTLCGSMRFFDHMLTVAAEETAAGKIVIAPFCVVAPSNQDSDLKHQLDVLHRHKIDAADQVIIVTDESEYFGESTEAEIRYAHSRGKPVHFRTIHTKDIRVTTQVLVVPDAE